MLSSWCFLEKTPWELHIKRSGNGKCINRILAPAIFLSLPEENHKWSYFIKVVADGSLEKGTGPGSDYHIWLYELHTAQCRYRQSQAIYITTYSDVLKP